MYSVNDQRAGPSSYSPHISPVNLPIQMPPPVSTSAPAPASAPKAASKAAPKAKRQPVTRPTAPPPAPASAPAPAPIPAPLPQIQRPPPILVPKDDYEGIANLSSQELKGEVIRLRQIVRRLTGLLTSNKIDYNNPDPVPTPKRPTYWAGDDGNDGGDEGEKLVSIDAHRPKWAGSGDVEDVKPKKERKPRVKKEKRKRAEGEEGEDGGDSDIQIIAKPKNGPLPKDETTGKRIERGRRLALAKVVRTQVSFPVYLRYEQIHKSWR